MKAEIAESTARMWHLVGCLMGGLMFIGWRLLEDGVAQGNFSSIWETALSPIFSCWMVVCTLAGLDLLHSFRYLAKGELGYERGSENCLGCGYLLKGLPALDEWDDLARCPECGKVGKCKEPAQRPEADVRLKLRAAAERAKAYLPLSLGLIMGLIVLEAAIWSLDGPRHPGRKSLEFWRACVQLAVLAFWAVVLLDCIARIRLQRRRLNC